MFYKINLLKHLLIITCVFLIACHSNKPEKKDLSYKNYTEDGYYFLDIKIDEKGVVKGKSGYTPFVEVDSWEGEINGTLKGNTISGRYKYQAEGEDYDHKVIVILKDSTAVFKEENNEEIILKLEDPEKIIVQSEENKNGIIQIDFSNAVNGYQIKAFWKPVKTNINHVIGPAIIEFYNTKDSTSFSITNNNFSILKNKLSFTYSDNEQEIIALNNTSITLSYNERNLKSEENFGTTNEPFFFQDLDFDNKEELILAEVGNGQRSGTSFKVYHLYEEDALESTNHEPFASLDEFSKVDHKRKEIIIYGSGGYCYNSYLIYKLLPINNYNQNEFVLDTIVEEERDDNQNKCYELVFKVINQRKQLISKKEVSISE